MQAGKLRHLVTLQTATLTKDGRGQDIETWANTVTDCPAEVVKLSGRELERAIQTSAEATWKVRIRHMDGLSTDMRIAYNGRTFEILDINNIDERDREIHILVKEHAATG